MPCRRPRSKPSPRVVDPRWRTRLALLLVTGVAAPGAMAGCDDADAGRSREASDEHDPPKRPGHADEATPAASARDGSRGGRRPAARTVPDPIPASLPAYAGSARPKPVVFQRGVMGGEPQLDALDARTHLAGPLAYTELHLTIANAGHMDTEARMELALPATAAVSRLAMDVGGVMEEGELVSTARARAAFANVVIPRRDPALLERLAGGRVRLRVFPVGRSTPREVIVGYTHEVTDAVTVPTDGLPTTKSLHATLHREGAGPTSHRESQVRPSGALVLTRAQGSASAARGGNLVAIRVTPSLTVADDPPERVTVLLDTSASRAGRLEDDVAALGAGLGALERSVPLRVVCFDQTVAECWSGSTSAFAGEGDSAVVGRGTGGASDPAGALRWLADHPAGGGRLLMVGDGVASLGDDLVAQAKPLRRALRDRGFGRVDALVTGGTRDEPALRALTTAEGHAAGTRIGPHASASEIAAGLQSGVATDVAVHVEGATQVVPEQLRAVRPGEPVIVYAELGPSAAGPDVAIRIGEGKQATITTQALPRTAVARAMARRALSIRELERRRADGTTRGAEAESALVDASMEAHVLSDATAMVVLETAADYARAGIERRAALDVVRLGSGGALTAGPLVRSRGGSAAPAAAPTGPTGWLTMAEPATLSLSPTAPTPPAPVDDDAAVGRNGPSSPVAPEVGPPGSGAGSASAPSSHPPPLPPGDDAFAPIATMRVWRVEGVADRSAARAWEEQVEAALLEQSDGLDWCHALRLFGGDRKNRHGMLSLRLADDGQVTHVDDARGTTTLTDCDRSALARLRLPPPPEPGASLELSVATTQWRRPEMDPDMRIGTHARVVEFLEDEPARALSLARDRVTDAPTDTIALLDYGRALAQTGDHEGAARAWGSLADWHPLPIHDRSAAASWTPGNGDAVSRRHFPRAEPSRRAMQSSVGLLAYLHVASGRPQRAMALLADALDFARLSREWSSVDTLEEDAARIAVMVLAGERSR